MTPWPNNIAGVIRFWHRQFRFAVPAAGGGGSGLGRSHHVTMKRPRQILLAFISVVSFYIGSYLYLSARGRFEPYLLDLRGVTGYSWYPEGFTGDFRMEWEDSLQIVYRPLWAADERMWHTSMDAWTGKYPVNKPGRYEALY